MHTANVNVMRSKLVSKDKNQTDRRFMVLTGNRLDDWCVFSFVKEDRRLISGFHLGLGGARRALGCSRLTLLTAAAAAVHESLTESLKHRWTLRGVSLRLSVSGFRRQKHDFIHQPLKKFFWLFTVSMCSWEISILTLSHGHNNWSSLTTLKEN